MMTTQVNKPEDEKVVRGHPLHDGHPAHDQDDDQDVPIETDGTGGQTDLAQGDPNGG